MGRNLALKNDRREWLDELAMAIVEHRTDDAIVLLHDAYPEEMPSVQVARLLSAARRMREVAA